MFTPSSVSSYPTYTPLPGMPSKAGTVGSEPRLREIRVVSNKNNSAPRHEWSETHSNGYTQVREGQPRPMRQGDFGSVPRELANPAQRFNAPIYSPHNALVHASASGSPPGRAPSLNDALGHQRPFSAPLAAQTPHLESQAWRARAAGPRAAAPRLDTSGSDARSSLVYRPETTAPAAAAATAAPYTSRLASSHNHPLRPGDQSTSDSTLSADRLRLVTAECQALLSTLREGSGASVASERRGGSPSLAASPPRDTSRGSVPSRPVASAADRVHLVTSTFPSSHADGTHDDHRRLPADDPERGYLHEPSPAHTRAADRPPYGCVASPRDDILGLEDDSRTTYNALMGALEELTAAHHHPPPPLSPHEGSNDSAMAAVCTAPADLAPELDTPADLIAPFSLKWMLFLVQRRERRLKKAEADSDAGGFSDEARHVLKMATTLRESLTYLQSTFATTLTRPKAQQLGQLLLYVSNVVSRFAEEDDVWHAACGQDRTTLSALCEELTQTVNTLDAVLAEKESLAEGLASTEAALRALQQQLDTTEAEKRALTSHYDRVAADNAEILARLHEAEEQAKNTSRREDGEGADGDGEGSQGTTSTERRCAIDALQEEYDRLQALMNRQTSAMRDLRGDLDGAENENDHLRAVIAQLRQSVVRHRTVVDLLTRRKMDGGVGLPDPSPQLIDDILSGAKAIDDTDLDTQDSLDYS